MNYLLPLSAQSSSSAHTMLPQRRSMRWAKRVLDLLITVPALLVLAPVFVVIAILIRLDSSGPILYTAKRAGEDYRVFPVFKFRTMYVDAEERLAELQHLNAYADPRTTVEPMVPSQPLSMDAYAEYAAETTVLVSDREVVPEPVYHQRQATQQGSAFVKLKNDPRITPVGRFLRNTSLDEVPQLFNVLRGDMSLVGNRPLPLYEADQLTSDGHVERFLAPAGLTGLWQVTKRGGRELSPEQRIGLDTQYARTYNLWLDLKLILQTVPAMLQEETM